MRKAISGEEKYFENKNLRRAGIPAVFPLAYSMVTLTSERALYCRLGEDGIEPTVPAANRDKMQDRNNIRWSCQGERFAG